MLCVECENQPGKDTGSGQFVNIVNRNSNLSDCERPTVDWKWRLSDRDFHNCSSISSGGVQCAIFDIMRPLTGPAA